MASFSLLFFASCCCAHTRVAIGPELPPDLALGCVVDDGSLGFLVSGADQGGSTVQRSTDGGKTWQGTNDSLQLIPLDVASYGSSAATSGALLIGDYSLDGFTRSMLAGSWERRAAWASASVPSAPRAPV